MGDKDKKVTLRIAETNPKFVGRGVALLAQNHLNQTNLMMMKATIAYQRQNPMA